ncbi:hypothetical protein [Marinobacter sp. F4206]|uniref:hypothetical protein n=1 Tax=Marinobacter sp. F4206 TaxID=2861777 RepID=UPI001C5DEAED|nr:hypothetical protein [Marinobacter sp. F4206]MBW4933561.1 hypothetical protein [Marinobacter sp. F4206]
MTLTKTKSLTLGALAIGLAAAAWFIPDAEQPKQSAPPTVAAAQTAETTSAQSAPKPAPSVAPENSDLDQVRNQLLEKYGAQLAHPKSQIRMLEELMRYLAQIDPEHWRENMLALLQAWFPNQHEALTQRMTSLLAYQTFMERERYALRAMTPDERRDFIWSKRRELFGDEAEIIWQAELQNRALAQSLQSINSDSGTPVRKAQAYHAAIEQAFGEQANRLLESRRQELTDRFLTLSSVQQTLHQQSAPERYDTLRAIRSELGMKETALNRWSELDRTRDERWSQGDRYQAKREAIMAKYEEGPERQETLEQAAEEMFGEDMAEVIRSEEAAGYYRFDGERVYGQN